MKKIKGLKLDGRVRIGDHERVFHLRNAGIGLRFGRMQSVDSMTIFLGERKRNVRKGRNVVMISTYYFFDFFNCKLVEAYAKARPGLNLAIPLK